MDLSRRDFIRSTSSAMGAVAGAAAGASLAGTAAEAAKGERPMQLAQAMTPAPSGFNPADPALKYDLVIAGGEVLDPSQRLRGRLDVGIRFGQIAALAPSMPPPGACSGSTRRGSS